MLEVELSVRQQMDARVERGQREFELRQRIEWIYQQYNRGLLTSQEAIRLVRLVEPELKRLTAQRTDIPFRGESVQNGAPATDAPANDAEVMGEGEWLGCWKIDMETGELVMR